MKVKFDKAYEHQHVEQSWYERWQKAGNFQAADKSDKPPFCIVIPPPNVTGSLHIGHALNNTLQDILIRFKRMDGFNTLWMPGTDHAGIATQNVVEKRLSEKGVTRQELGREAFIEEVWKWKEASGNQIIQQLKRLGASCDWRRLRFTMDEGLSKAVRHVFVELYQQGYIYRDSYIINWCPRCQTALSDLEVEHEEHAAKIYTIRYPFKEDKQRHVEVATTRPETMLGDVAVAVHPEDERYKDIVGKDLCLPLVDKAIPVVADSAVKMEFGTGAVKITPAHDFNDFEMGRRHSLPSVNIMDDSANIHLPKTPYHGLSIKEARKAVVNDLKKQKLFVGDKDHRNMVGHCYRCKTVVEPRVSKQWFVKTEDLAKQAIETVKNKETQFVPENWQKTYFEWMENIRDWCISRQIWWGHRIPVWYCEACNEMTVAKEDPNKCSSCASTKLAQDDDVLDTWFSSALWPFSTLGWPERTQALQTFYPTSVLSTGFDIIFFWVARMMMMGLKFMGDVPFRIVNIHALIRDAEGQKMSKSKGNVVDPLELMDRYGTDSVRFSLAALAVQGRDIIISEDRIKGYRHFVNKLWNASRFVAMSIENLREATGSRPLADNSSDNLPLAERWINKELQQLIGDVRQAYEELRFSDAANLLYQFVWHQYCDWYIEMSKADISCKETADASAANLLFTLDKILRLLHPLMPFVTEEIWNKLTAFSDAEEVDYLMLAEFPKTEDFNNKTGSEVDLKDIELLKKIIVAIRTLKSENNVSPSKSVDVVMSNASSSGEVPNIASLSYVVNLARTEKLTFIGDFHIETNRYEGDSSAVVIDSSDTSKLTMVDASTIDLEGPVASTVTEGISITLPLGKLIDVEKEKVRLNRDITKVKKDLQSLAKKLENEAFIKNAPKEVVEEQRSRQEQGREKLASLQAFLKRLQTQS